MPYDCNIFSENSPIYTLQLWQSTTRNLDWFTFGALSLHLHFDFLWRFLLALRLFLSVIGRSHPVVQLVKLLLDFRVKCFFAILFVLLIKLENMRFVCVVYSFVLFWSVRAKHLVDEVGLRDLWDGWLCLVIMLVEKVERALV